MRRQQIVSVVYCFSALLAVGGSVYADYVRRPSWLSSVEPVVTKLSELPPNQEPMSKSADCTPTQLPNGSGFIDTCAYTTPLGTIANNTLLDGPKGAYPLETRNSGTILPSVPGKPNLLITSQMPRSWSSGTTLRIGAYDSALLKYAEYYGLPTVKQYEYLGQPTTFFKDASGNQISFETSDIAYSANGEWLAARVSGNGLYLKNFSAQHGKLITWEAADYTSGGGYTKTNNIAVSSSGRYVAITLSVQSGNTTRPALRVYDRLTCRDQYALRSEVAKHNSCEYKDLWTGEYRTGNTRGLRDMVQGAEYPRRVRFVDDKTITFDSVYDRTGPTSFKVACYSVTMPQETVREYVGVLGMGDSYISGEGAAGTYLTGTDTKQNKCHLSWYSYPYQTGAKEFPYGRSVACSGARMYDVTVTSVFAEGIKDENEQKYGGQGADRYTRKWANRDSTTILNTFTPGYANQVIFTREYKPRTILLSIGGNDIHFANILSSCVDPKSSKGTCYEYYEDRIQIMKNVLEQYDKLVKTYKSVLTESGGARVYVVGYPQIAKVDGNCGANVLMNSAEIRFGSQLITYLNSIIKRAAAEAGAYYVDTESALNGYRLCEAPKNKAAMNGATKGNDSGPLNMIGQESYHPTVFGHKLLGQTILAKTYNLTVTMPAPVKNNKPALDTTNALLQVPHNPEADQRSRSIKWPESDAVSLFQQNNRYTTNIPPGTLQKVKPIEIVLHSTPVTLYEGDYSDQPVVITIPSTVEPGFHRLDIYGTDSSGQPIDLRQVVYVTASATNYDGDDLPNLTDPCPSLPQSGTDEDADGIDDACDGEIRDIPLDDPLPELPPQNPLSFDSDDAEDEGYANSLLKPYVLPQVKPTEENSSSQTKTDSNILSTASNPGAGMASQLTTALRVSGNLAPYYGHALFTHNESMQNAANPQGSTTEVLGTTTLRVPKIVSSEGSNDWRLVYVLASVFVVFMAALMLRKKARRKRM